MNLLPEGRAGEWRRLAEEAEAEGKLLAAAAFRLQMRRWKRCPACGTRPRDIEPLSERAVCPQCGHEE